MPIVAGSTTTFRHSFSSSRAAIALFTPIVGGAFKVVRVLYGTPTELSIEGDTTDVDCLTGPFRDSATRI
jgi:hypothetical protein